MSFRFVESSRRQRAGSVRPSLFTPVGSKPTIGCELQAVNLKQPIFLTIVKPPPETEDEARRRQPQVSTARRGLARPRDNVA
jgi:hypothetical protein